MFLVLLNPVSVSVVGIDAEVAEVPEVWGGRGLSPAEVQA